MGALLESGGAVSGPPAAPRRAAALAAACVLCACGPRRPAGLERVDSGTMSRSFRVDRGLGRLYWISGGDELATSLETLDIASGRRYSRRIPGRQLLELEPFPAGGAVDAVAENAAVDDGRIYFMRLSPEDGKVLAEEPREDAESAAESLRLSPAPAEKNSAAGAAASVARAVGGARPGVRIATADGAGRRVRFYALAGEPDLMRFAADGSLYVTYDGPDGWRLDELFASGQRLPLARLSGEATSLLAYRANILVLHRNADDSAWLLGLVNADAQRLLEDLPWSRKESRLLAVDPVRRRLYVAMTEADDGESCWSIPFDQRDLEAASRYLTKARGADTQHVSRSDLFMAATFALALVFFAGVIFMRPG